MQTPREKGVDTFFSVQRSERIFGNSSDRHYCDSWEYKNGQHIQHSQICKGFLLLYSQSNKGSFSLPEELSSSSGLSDGTNTHTIFFLLHCIAGFMYHSKA